MKVLVALDDSEFARGVVRSVTGMSWPAASTFLVVSAVELPIITGPGEFTSEAVIEKVLEERRRVHGAFAKEAVADLLRAGLKAEARVINGDARFTIVDEARREGSNLIVVGTHGRTGLKRLIMGSVASYVVAHAPCSVLVVRPAS